MSELDQEKALYERFWCLLRDRQLMTIFEKYGPEAFRRSSVLEGFESLLFMSNFRGKTCVEIGTLKGLTAIVLARYFERVVTIDIVEDPQKREFAELLGVKNIAFVNVRNNIEKAEVLSAVQFDAAYVDGDHHRDTLIDFEMVARCGRVLMHEHWSSQPAVVQLFDCLRQRGRVVTQGKFAVWTR